MISTLARNFLLILLLSTLLFSQSQIKEGIRYYEENNIEKAENIFHKILDQNENNAEANYYLGLINYIHKNDFDSAENFFEEAVDNDPDNAQYHYWLGATYGTLARDASIFSQLSLASSCKEEFEKTIELDPKHIEGRVGLIQYLIQAPGIAGGDLDEAKEHIEKLKDLSLYHYYTTKTTLALYDKNFQEAVKFLNEAIAVDSTKIDAYNSLGYLYLLNLNEPQKAINTFKKMVSIQPDIANSYDSLGDGYFSSKMYNEALASYKKALAINQDFQASIYNVARVYDELKNKSEAVKWYKKYLSKVDQGRRSDKARERLNELE